MDKDDKPLALHVLTQLNPADIPMTDTHVYLWCMENGTGSILADLVLYIGETVGPRIRSGELGARSLCDHNQTLRTIIDHYYWKRYQPERAAIKANLYGGNL